MLQNIQRAIEAESNKGGDAKLVRNLMKICSGAGTLLASFTDASKGQALSQPQIEELVAKMKNLKEEVLKINIQLGAKTNVPPIHKQGPGKNR
jgi:hypothetical protein